MKFDPQTIRDISVRVYKERLGAEDTKRMLEKDNDDGEKIRERADAYDPLTRIYLAIFLEEYL